MPIKLTTAMLALLLGGIIMGFSPVFVREAEVGAFASAFWRVLFALPALYLWARLEQDGPGIVHSFRRPSIIAGLLFAGDLALWHLAILNTTMANATFMVCLSPVWVAVASPWVLGERVERRALIGLVICLIGLAMLIGSSFQVDPSRLLGDFYGLVTSFFLGFYFVAMRFGRRDLPSGKLFFGSTVVTTLTLFVVAILAGGPLVPESQDGWIALASLGLLTHAGGQGLVTFAIGTLSAMFSSLVIFVEAIAAAFFGWLLFDEAMTPLQWLGSIFILAGVWLAGPRGQRDEPR